MAGDGLAGRILKKFFGSGEDKARIRIAEAAAAKTLELDLSELGLASLPPEIGRLTALQELYLSFNQLTSPRPEVVSQGIGAIRAYLREMDKAAVPLRSQSGAHR